ncbi:ribonuclease HII [Raoultibacter phocaeensis]|uniref:ribonuclease HII n=1 Tax=Raoultibacter phocaeensis TaxID=2479841 RepID=UPI001119564F|nr:ribonuclease HII [Raoultibacter phocaeensis]
MSQTVADIRSRLQQADAAEFAVLERSLVADTRKGIASALESARHRLEAEALEEQRIASLYALQHELAEGGLAVGLDEVGRGPVAGPLTVGAVVLPGEPRIPGLNDSKQLTPERREELSIRIKEVAIAWTIQHVQPDELDAVGMTASLRFVFHKAVMEIEAQGIRPDAILLDGNPLRIDPRERSVVKGDAKCASIAAASIVAKVERDRIMCLYAEQYPAYCFDANKGYASKEHIEAIKNQGLCPIHRTTFCTAFVQETLF